MRDRRPPGPRCLCVSRSATFLPNADGGHTRRAHFCDARSSSATTPLLGGLAQFCAAFYHANSWEADVRSASTSGGPTYSSDYAHRRCGVPSPRRWKCAAARRRAREVIKGLPFTGAQIPGGHRRAPRRRGGGELYVARYANCPRPLEDNTHAEEFLLADAALADAIAARAGARLEL